MIISAIRTVRGFSAALPLLAACGDEPAFPESRQQGEPVEVRVWIQDHPLIDASAVLDACNEWSPMKLACVAVSDRDEADIAAVLSDDDCGNAVINGQSARTLMRAEGSRTLKMYGACMSKRRERIPDDTDWYVFLRGNVKHEFGHLFGWRGHVPYFCDGTDDEPVLTHPSGVRICGPANMNASNYVPRATPLAAADFLGLDLRPSGFVLPPDPHPLFPDGTVPTAEMGQTGLALGVTAQALHAEDDGDFACDLIDTDVAP
jgi:hypothetical protein